MNIDRDSFNEGIRMRRQMKGCFRDTIMNMFMEKWRELGRPEEGHENYVKLVSFRQGYWSQEGEKELIDKKGQLEMF